MVRYPGTTVLWTDYRDMTLDVKSELNQKRQQSRENYRKNASCFNEHKKNVLIFLLLTVSV